MSSPRVLMQVLLCVVLIATVGIFSISSQETGDDEIVSVELLSIEQSSTDLMYTPEMFAIQRAGGTWAELFDRDSLQNKNQVVAVIVWWLTMMTFTFCSWGILFYAFPKLADRGYSVAKLIGLVLVAWILYVLGTLRFEVWSQTGIIGLMLVLTIFNGFVVWFQRDEMLRYIRQNWRLLMVIEGLTVFLFILLLIYRLFDPHLVGGYSGEAPMDFAYLNGVLRSTIFPPIDPWFAGGYNNYYYLGFIIVAVPNLLTGIIPSIAYNLILPTLFALVGIGAFGLGFNMLHALNQGKKSLAPYLAGGIAVVLTLLIGNLDIPRLLFNMVSEVGGYQETYGHMDYYIHQAYQEYYDEYGEYPSVDLEEQIQAQIILEKNKLTFIEHINYELALANRRLTSFFEGLDDVLIDGKMSARSTIYWLLAPTRTIAFNPHPHARGYLYDIAINETPIASFVYGDVHAHVISMPLLLFVLLFVFHEVLFAMPEKRSFVRRITALMLGALVVGILRGVNTWDYPTALILCIAGLGFVWWHNTAVKYALSSILSLLGWTLGFVILTIVVILPYTLWYQMDNAYLVYWIDVKTPIWAYISIYGLPIFLMISLLLWDSSQWTDGKEQIKKFFSKRRNLTYILLFQIFAFILIIPLEYQVAIVVSPLILWIAILFFRSGQTQVMRYLLVLMGLGLTITFGVEFFKINIDSGRQNIVFKFYMQVWLIFGVLGGVIVAHILNQLPNYVANIRGIWRWAFGILLVISLMYPVFLISQKLKVNFNSAVPWTLDGMEYMKYTEYEHFDGSETYYHDMSHDYQMIHWMQDNIMGTPTLIEAQSGSYTFSGRVSVYTGLPSVLGWSYHQSQQRRNDKLIQQIVNRKNNIQIFYNTSQITDAAHILNHYGIEYVVFGDYERNIYGITDDHGESAILKEQKFPQMVELGILTPVYQENGQTIYRVNEHGLRQYLMMGTE